MKRSQKERDELIEEWYPLALKMSRVVRTARYFHEDDRLSAALIGLLQAAESYNGKISFKQYAAFVIRRQIKIESWLNRNIHLPHYLRTRIVRYRNGEYVPEKKSNKGQDPRETMDAVERLLKATVTNDVASIQSRTEIDEVVLKEMLTQSKRG